MLANLEAPNTVTFDPIVESTPLPNTSDIAAPVHQLLLMPRDLDKYRLIRTLLVELECDDGMYIVSDPSSSVFGAGRSVQKAFDVFFAELVDRFEAFTQAKALSPMLRDELHYLKSVLEVA